MEDFYDHLAGPFRLDAQAGAWAASFLGWAAIAVPQLRRLMATAGTASVVQGGHGADLHQDARRFHVAGFLV
ncbi:hypothetical protein RBK84_00620, partial [Pseudomonas aeruginosa]|uniref:hypothetical protein n=1 Tax=Pseudomonas aeruginosa TaxID=287 RepID=UPI0027D38EF8